MWKIDTTSHFKIWFSDDPNCFLGIENELRFIHTLQKNPQATFTFVFSSSCLTPYALERLKNFCKRHKIIPLDFDTELRELLTEEQDIKIYNLAAQEIHNARKQAGGNMAGASDCVRTIVPLIETCGAYGDFDLSLNFSQQPKMLPVKVPIILSAQVIQDNAFQGVTFNNEFIIAARDPANPSKLCQEAIQSLREVQADILARYASPQQTFFKNPIKGLPEIVFAHNPDLTNVIKHYFRKYPDADLFSLRRVFQQINIRDYFDSQPVEVRVGALGQADVSQFSEKELEQAYFAARLGLPSVPSLTEEFDFHEIVAEKLTKLKHQLEILFVGQFSGPVCYFVLLKEAVPKEGFTQVGQSVVPREKWEKYLQGAKYYDLTSNQIGQCVATKNSAYSLEKSLYTTDKTLHLIGVHGDQSWSSLGAQKKRLRQAEMADSAIEIQQAWRAKKQKKLSFL